MGLKEELKRLQCNRLLHKPWRDFKKFLEDNGNPPLDSHIELIGQGAIIPGSIKIIPPTELQTANRKLRTENCKPISANRELQTANQQKRGTAKKLTHNNQTLSIRGWAKFLGVSDTAIRKRIKKGQTIEQIVTEIGQ